MHVRVCVCVDPLTILPTEGAPLDQRGMNYN